MKIVKDEIVSFRTSFQNKKRIQRIAKKQKLSLSLYAEEAILSDVELLENAGLSE
jgi:hypothetical protein